MVKRHRHAELRPEGLKPEQRARKPEPEGPEARNPETLTRSRFVYLLGRCKKLRTSPRLSEEEINGKNTKI